MRLYCKPVDGYQDFKPAILTIGIFQTSTGHWKITDGLTLGTSIEDYMQQIIGADHCRRLCDIFWQQIIFYRSSSKIMQIINAIISAADHSDYCNR